MRCLRPAYTWFALWGVRFLPAGADMTAYLFLHLSLFAVLSADYTWLADIQPVAVIEIRAEQTKVIKEVQNANHK